MQNFVFLSAISPVVIVIVLLVILLLFGGSKIPELARGLAKARKEFKKATEEVENEINDTDSSASAKPSNNSVDVASIEEEERAKIRARIEAEERAKYAATKSNDDSSAK